MKDVGHSPLLRWNAVRGLVLLPLPWRLPTGHAP